MVISSESGVGSRPRTRDWPRLLGLLTLVLAATAVAGCGGFGPRLFFSLLTDPPRELPAGREVHDLPYVDGEDAEPKHRYDLFLPAAEAGWPTAVFVHGGGWNSGDRDLAFGDFEVYGSIGRRLALEGIGAAVISYRLQPDVSWRQQVDDVARAVVAVRAEVARRGGAPERLFLAGHSAGAYFATYVALRDELLDELGTPRAVCGVAAISGVAYDLADPETYRLGADPEYYRKRFDTGEGWEEDASAVTWLDGDDPPILLLYGTSEWPALQHQNRLLAKRLEAADVPVALHVEKRVGHRRMVLKASDPDEDVFWSIVDFVRSTDCST